MIELGKQFVVMGDWDESPEPEGKTVIRMPVAPHHTYGCWHQTTQMCIEELERRVKPGMVVLDFGTGSGILAMVAYLLGAEKVYATEIDPKVAIFAQYVYELNHTPIWWRTWKDLEDLPEVDICVANIGDNLWDLRHQINAKTLINVSHKGELVVVNA